uniref:Uncharacterized protein n=1 Tax=Oryzias latipes TaxID=8090 RepID=A0A3B3IAE5_ORYLA
MRWVRVNRELVAECSLLVTKLRKGCEYDFRVSAENAAGLSPPSEPSATFRALDPLVVPSRPTKPKIVNSTKDSVSIVWKPPISDGGAPILGYSVEFREYLRKPEPEVEEEEEEEDEYEEEEEEVTESPEELARWVEAIPLTKTGEGPFSDASDYYKAADPVGKLSQINSWCICLNPPASVTNILFTDPPYEPCKLRWLDSTKTSITLGWSKPEWDGGSEITSYMVEKLVEGQQEWEMITSKGEVKTTEYTVHQLQPNVNYFFRVSAVNSAGRGEPLEMTEAVQAKDILGKSSSCNIMKNVELCVPLKGRPAPIASWSKEEECIDCNPKYEFHHSDSTTVLVMRDVTRLDTGKYTVKIQNGVGEPKTLTLSVKVQDTPAQCRNLVLKDVSRGKVTLVWERPLLDGGADITNYIVEKRDSSKRSYSAVTNKCTETTYTIEDLSEKTSYFFRVLAENENGVGDPCDTREKYFEGLSVKAGENLKLKVTVTGRPVPKVIWYKDDVEITKKMMDITNIPGSSTLFVRDADRTYRGLYTIEATNGSGTKKESILVQVQGTQMDV